jgi:hypothetical protein
VQLESVQPVKEVRQFMEVTRLSLSESQWCR